jgi:hypothetical protein
MVTIALIVAIAIPILPTYFLGKKARSEGHSPAMVAAWVAAVLAPGLASEPLRTFRRRLNGHTLAVANVSGSR